MLVDKNFPTANLLHPTDLYARRRVQLAAQLGESGIAIIPTAASAVRNRDAEYPYRFDSYFYYLCGFSEPNACLVLFSTGRAILFCQSKNLEREIWDGFRLGVEAAPNALGVDEAYPVENFEQELPKLLENKNCVWYPFAVHAHLESRIASALSIVRQKVRLGVACPSIQSDVCVLLDEMRLIKDDYEQDVMRRAAIISAKAHVRAMQTCAQMLRKGFELREYHLEAELLHEFRFHGAQSVAYNSIVAAGVNACVLHYRADSALIRPDDLVLIDAACELDGYASDITRTFPAQGVFSAPQRDLYAVVLAAQSAAIDCVHIGANFADAHSAALSVLSQGLLDLKILQANQVGFVQDVIEKKAYMPFYMHKTGHWLGLDVHDCGAYLEKDGKTSRSLQAGMVLTVEPGLYIRPSASVPQAFWNLGIRIEDDVLVTLSGCELLTRQVPVQMDEIEALMRA